MKKKYGFVAVLLLMAVASFAQIRKVPAVVKQSFARQYPKAENVKYNDDLVNVNVSFLLDGEKMNAEYTNKGIWKHTEKKWSFEQLPDSVKEGFHKSRFADRDVKEVVVIYLPADVTQYRIKAEKSSLEKKYLFFSPEGRLLRESITI
ncbi:MAG: PepSY-like domain-containing protein [Chitinophagaceae bacterium]